MKGWTQVKTYPRTSVGYYEAKREVARLNAEDKESEYVLKQERHMNVVMKKSRHVPEWVRRSQEGTQKPKDLTGDI
jgi:hypothetical protein